MNKSVLLFLSFILSILAIFSKAQSPRIIPQGRIEGQVIDTADKQPIEYATVALFLNTDNKIINGTTTDSKGKFVMTGIQKGEYRIVINFMGYDKRELSNILITDKVPVVSVGRIFMLPKTTSLDGVTIVGQKNVIENKIDKMVYNAENDITSQSGVAIDVLKKVPQISIDINGNVELQGSSGIRFLIDGKPSTIYGNSINDVLQSIPASQIQSIEVITSPGAKYDAEGTGGIINILLKKTRVNGLSGNASLSAGTRLENGTINLTARTGHFGINGFLSGNAQLESSTTSYQSRITTNPDRSLTNLEQNGESKFRRNGYQAGIGIDWDFTRRDNLSGGVNFNHWENSGNGLTWQLYQIYDSTGHTLSQDLNNLHSGNHYHSNTTNWDLAYKHKFSKKGQELSIQYNSGYTDSYSDYQQSLSRGSADTTYSGTNGNNPGTDLQTNISFDYSHPFGEKTILEAGAKATMEELHSYSDVTELQPGTGEYVPDASQSHSLKYARNIYAVYITGSFSLFRFLDVKPGIREEYTGTSITNAGIPDSAKIPSYTTFVPSLFLSHSFKNNHSVKLSYTYRIERPDYRDLNPFVNLSDPHNVSTGNPSLKPEISNGIELGYNKSFKKGGNINIAGYYRWNTDDIQNFVTYYPTYKVGDSVYTDVTVSSRENISSETRIGGNIFASVPFLSIFNVRSNISLYNRTIDNNGPNPSRIQSFEYRITLNLTVQIQKTLALEVFGNFNSPRTTAQGKNPSWSSYNMAVRKKFFKEKASIALTVVNPFNPYVYQKTSLQGDNFLLNSNRKIEFRSFGINFTYKFGKMKFRTDREDENNNMMNAPTGF